MATFRYNSGNPTLGSSYTQVSSISCPGTDFLCSIQADADANNQPVITSALISEMLIAVVTQTPSTNVKLKN